MEHAPFAQPFAHGIYKQKYAQPGEEWSDTAKRVTEAVLGALWYTKGARNGLAEEITPAQERIQELIDQRKFIPGGRYLYAAGRDYHQVQNCLLLRAEDSREGWAELNYKATMALQTGAGIGIDYSRIRPSGSVIKRTGGVASGPLALMQMVNEVGRGVMQGGSRRSAIWAGLNWQHEDIFDFINLKNWLPEVRELKEKDFTFPATMDMTNISVQLDDEFFRAMNDPKHRKHDHAAQVYQRTLKQMVVKAEPGFSVDTGADRYETLRNACTEVTSADDSDICNLGSLNISAFHSKDQFGAAVRDATLFLIAGTLYSDLPYEKVKKVREQNRRLGLGLMGIHEWLLQRGKRYGPDLELGEWLEEYERSTEHANKWADKLDISRPIKTRAIAPTGTIGIIGETTTGIEPIFAAAFKRRIRNADPKGDTTQFEYVIDPTAKRLIDQGVDPDTIEDAYQLSYDVERRIEMQAWVQQYVDQAISSTVNLPYPLLDIQDRKDFSDILLKYLHKLRGITCYPDRARGGQPLTVVPLEVALEQSGTRFEETEERCVGGACGV